MKRVLALFFALVITACTDAKHISAEEFMAHYKWVGQPQSVSVVTYLGQKDGKAFVKISSMSSLTNKWSEQIVYVELSELPQSFRSALPVTAIRQ